MSATGVSEGRVSPERWSALPSAVRPALARWDLYRALSWAFLYPDQAALEAAFASFGEAARYQTDLPSHAASLAAARALADGALADGGLPDIKGLQAQYDRIFGHTISAECPPYETQYGAGIIFAQAHRLGDIAAFYRAYGVQVSPQARERPDHIAAELEFMSTMAFREAVCLIEGNLEHGDDVRQSARKFLVEHLASWALFLAERLGRKARSVAPPQGGYYAALALALDQFLRDELRAAQVSPDGIVPVEPVQFDFEPDGCSFACGPTGEPVLYNLPGAGVS